MAKGKGKKVSSGGPHKKHGPKRKLFHEWSKVTRMDLAKSGVLTKYYNKTSFELSLQARGIRNIPSWLWDEMISLPTQKEKEEWFKGLKSRNLVREDKEREEKKAAKQALKQAEAPRQTK